MVTPRLVFVAPLLKGGLPWGEVVSWYCNQHQQELTSEEDLSNMQKLVNQVRC